MQYLSKETILSAYKLLSKLTSDPSAQGATQVTSSLRYLFALDQFFKSFGKPCNTQNKEDRDKFIEFVGVVVAVNDNLYTANFFNSLKNNADYAVGSNFFSVNTVKNSLENSSKDYDFPKRGNSPLFVIRNGELIEKIDYLPNLLSVLSDISLRTAFSIWLVRNMEINADDAYNSVRTNLLAKYSEELINILLPPENEFDRVLPLTYSQEKPTFNLSDFPKQVNKSNESNFSLLPPDELIAKVRDSFIKFWNLIDQHGADKDSFVGNFENALNPFIEQLDLGYTSVFQIIDFDQYEAIISEVVAKHPEISYVVNGRSNHGTRYEVGSTHLHYRNYLQIIAQSDFRANLDIQKKKTMSVVSNTTAADLSQYLRAMRTKPFLLLAGISGTGKSRIVKQMAFDSCPDNSKLRKDATTPGNYCLVEVKPNWHDSSELIGYASQIGRPHYEVTPFVRFLAKAMLYEEQRVPFFVCLDEMNLAPVEQYFAEFLSVLESRKVVNGRITSEALIPAEVFAKYEDQLKKDLFGIQPKEVGVTYHPGGTSDPEAYYGAENAVYDRLKNEGLRIPSNLIVIGTVNMDETTYQFSRKVIDRAMTIEMNLPEGEPFLDFFNNARDLEYNDSPFSADLFLPSIVKAADALEALSEDNAEQTEWLKKEVATILTELNAALEDTPFKIAYRVQNELMLYFSELWKENNAAEWSDILSESVDQILMMKVLPRVEGDEDLLEKPLASLANFCATGNYRKAAQKVAEMKNRLDRAHFTSYWP